MFRTSKAERVAANLATGWHPLRVTIRFSESIEVDGQGPVLWLKRWNPDDIEVLLKLRTVSFAELHEWMPWAAQELTREAQLEFLKASQSAWEKGDGIDHALIVEENRVGTRGLFRWEDEPDDVRGQSQVPVFGHEKSRRLAVIFNSRRAWHLPSSGVTLGDGTTLPR